MSVLSEAKTIDKQFHYFNSLDSDAKGGKGKLSGVAVSVKDCICVKGLESRAGSAILDGYQPVFDATVVSKVKKEGGMILGKTSQDAFGFGSFSVNVGNGMKVPLNPFDVTRSCGGSSGGAAGFTQAASQKGIRHIALSESTGGSIVCPASFCGVLGLCPTYGRVSRYGLMDYANSLDKIGVMATTLEDVALLMSVIAGYDAKDSTSLDEKVPSYKAFLGKSIKGLKIGVLKNSFGKGVDKEVSEKVTAGIALLEERGAKIVEVSLPLTEKYGVQCYYLLAMAEASTNLAKYSGMRYGKHEKLTGHFNSYFTSVRSKHFNTESKRRIMLGTFARMAGYRDAYYLQAAKVRTLIIKEYKKAFSSCDVLVSPTMPFVAPKFTEISKLSPLQQFMADRMTVGPNLGGFPHMSVPVGSDKKGLPIGLLLTGDHLEEGKLMQVGSQLL